MILNIDVGLSYGVPEPCNILLQIEAASMGDQTLLECDFNYSFADTMRRVKAEEGIGERILASAHQAIDCTYHAKVEITRKVTDFVSLTQEPFTTVDGELIKYLMPSRYCHPDDFFNTNPPGSDGLSGGALIEHFRHWIETTFNYTAGVSDSRTTAYQTYLSRQGVCRDYAHVLIALARAASIPARMASVYAPSVSPPDFHAVVEVYLEGAWHLVDPTGMTNPNEIVRIGVGRDAADVSFMTAYGYLDPREQSVCVTAI